MYLKLLSKLQRFYTKTDFFRECHSIFGLKDIVHQDKLANVSLLPVTTDKQELAIDVIKQHFLTEHVLMRARGINLVDDRALDEYLFNLLKQGFHLIPQLIWDILGNSLYAKTHDGAIAGLCVSFASSPDDPRNLRNFAFYRQDPNTKDFLYFTAKLQETPNLWNIYKEPKVFEIKMLTVLPEYRRQGLATMLVEKAQTLAQDQGYNVLRMDCINSYDYKVAERCMLKCLTKFPLHKLRGPNAPFIKRNSEYNRCVRVYVNANTQFDSDTDKHAKDQLRDLENLFD